MKPHLLEPQQFPRVEPLFHELAGQHLFCGGVLSGKYPGQIVVDNVERPRSALMIKGGMWCYLGGDAGNRAFNRALSEALTAKQWVGADAWGLLFINPGEKWRKVLYGLAPERTPIFTPRKVYAADAEHFAAPPPLPGEFALHAMDESLRGYVDGDLPEDVTNVLALRAGSDDPDRAACGYVAVCERACAAWAMVDCIVGDHGEIGLFTADAYRRRGLAAAVSGATIRYGLNHGLSAIHWDVVAYNAPSIRLAEKHGLKFIFEYDQALIVYALDSHMVNQVWSLLDEGDFWTAVIFGEKLLGIKKNDRYGNYLVGAAWAGLGVSKRALRYLHWAVDYGWNDVSLLESTPSLQSLRGTPEWEALVARMKNNDNS